MVMYKIDRKGGKEGSRRKSTSWFVTKMQKVKINLVANFKISNIYF